jgi:hypothetical protein
LYIESLKDYVKVVTKTKNIITKQSISSLEDLLQEKTLSGFTGASGWLFFGVRKLLEHSHHRTTTPSLPTLCGDGDFPSFAGGEFKKTYYGFKKNIC